MNRIYQPIVLEKASDLIVSLISADFFVEYQIDNTEFAYNYLCDKLTETFIRGDLNEEFTIEDIPLDLMETYLKEIVVGTTVEELVEKGILQIESDNNDDMYRITELGKLYKELMIRP